MAEERGNRLTTDPQRLLRRRRLTVAAVVLATFLFLLMYNLGSYWFIERMGRNLEESLDKRLRATALLTSQSIERDSYNLGNPDENGLLRLTLNRIRLDHELEAAYILDNRLGVVLDARLDLENSVSRGYLVTDSSAINLTRSGRIGVSSLHRIAGDDFKTVYAPLSDLLGDDYILALEANADFLQVMSVFRRGMFAGMVISALLLIVLTVFLVTATSLLLQTEARLMQAKRLAYMGQMAATVAHEIRNPLAIIKSTADVLREKNAPPESVREYFGYIDDEVRRLNRLVSDFLSLSREPELQWSMHDLSILLREAMERFAAGSVTFSFSCTQDILPIRGDADKLHQVLMNVFLNARQAVQNPVAHIEIRLSRQTCKGKPWACIQITDNGSGLQGRGNDIFEPFFTTKSSGTGLGLAVSRQIIQAHGGTMEAADAPQGGTEIRILLPAGRP